MKSKGFSIIFEGLSLAEKCLRPETAPLQLKITFRDYKFDYLKFNNELKNILMKENINNCEFDGKSMQVLDKHARSYWGQKMLPVCVNLFELQ